MTLALADIEIAIKFIAHAHSGLIKRQFPTDAKARMDG
jgi:hypothetical protein